MVVERCAADMCQTLATSQWRFCQIFAAHRIMFCVWECSVWHEVGWLVGWFRWWPIVELMFSIKGNEYFTYSNETRCFLQGENRYVMFEEESDCQASADFL